MGLYEFVELTIVSANTFSPLIGTDGGFSLAELLEVVALKPEPFSISSSSLSTSLPEPDPIPFSPSPFNKYYFKN